MNPAHLHLMVNHIPVLGTAFVAIVLAWAMVSRSRDLARFGLLATVVLAVVTIPVFRTGEPAEEFLEHEAWFDEDTAHEHEERAELGLIAILITGAGAAFALYLSRGDRPVHRGASAAVLAGVVLSAGLFGWSALEGGEIRHAEIHLEAPSPEATEAPHEDD